MSDVLSTLVAFRKSQLDERFKSICKCTVLQRSEVESALHKEHKESGVYFWLLEHKSMYYPIYVGQTVSLAGRQGRYIENFQAHVPNNFKLRVFFGFVNELLPDATIELFYLKTDRGNLGSEERAAIEKYRPLLNNLPQPTPEEKEKLQKAFSDYYTSVFKRRLNP